jgi:hypothetical protein
LNQRFNVLTAVAVAALLGPVSAGAQAPETRERTLALGWTALAAGSSTAARDAATRILKRAPRDHDAASLAIAADLAAGGPPQALDAYERWLQASGREDQMLLEDISAAFLKQLSGAGEPRIVYPALGALARFGDADAREKLRRLVDDPAAGVEAEVALAAAGDPAGAERLRARIAAGGRDDKSRAIDALKSGGSAAGASIAPALKDPSPASRIAAAHALAEIGAADAIPQLREAAADPEPSVRGAVQAALALLGDPDRAETLKSLQSSPLAEYRLLSARRAAAAEPRGAWVSTAETILGDPDPVVRLEAAELLLTYGHTEAAEPVIFAALTAPSGPLRSTAARLLARVPLDLRGLAALRRMLRDTLPEVRLEAARALLISR